MTSKTIRLKAQPKQAPTAKAKQAPTPKGKQAPKPGTDLAGLQKQIAALETKRTQAETEARDLGDQIQIAADVIAGKIKGATLSEAKPYSDREHSRDQDALRALQDRQSRQVATQAALSDELSRLGIEYSKAQIGAYEAEMMAFSLAALEVADALERNRTDLIAQLQLLDDTEIAYSTASRQRAQLQKKLNPGETPEPGKPFPIRRASLDRELQAIMTRHPMGGRIYRSLDKPRYRVGFSKPE